ncbi:hypothetical protein PHLCEN_2v8415 [Hermanssonia centrifuga]|uniref:DNA-directed DNA polymerase n=1 Tax=Hermanssonia centrifuga TaxID=98765 RepID=A0A2R6NTR2_9APHY|nr:hypothetical protein PHLCEN_2v8415 [Hermanssonia centrifuga]
MDKQFGLHFLLQTYLGIASNVVQPGQREERKSIGAERTFSAIGDKNKILAKLEEVAAELEEDMERTGWTGKTVTLKYKLDTYEVFTRAKSFDRWISTKKEDLFATGKELLMPELPLKIRLIGLRVTKLKDLRLDTDKEPGSIKRFFESAKPPASPSKKRNSEPKIDDEDSEVEPNLTQDGYEDAMPGYHEEIELDIEELRPEDNLPQHGDDSVMAEKLRPPASSSGAKSHKPASSSSTSNSSRPFEPIRHVNSDSSSSKPASKSTSTTKPSSKRKRSLTPNSGRNLQTEICPICEKNWETDNRGLNEHIDFCLSKGAIREAQAMASNQTALSALQPDSVSRGGPNQTGRKAARKR